MRVIVARELPARSAIPVLLARSSSSVPLALPRPATGTDQVKPPSMVAAIPMLLLLTMAVPLSVKLLKVTPATALLKVAWKVTLLALVSWLLGVKRLIEFNVGAT